MSASIALVGGIIKYVSLYLFHDPCCSISELLASLLFLSRLMYNTEMWIRVGVCWLIVSTLNHNLAYFAVYRSMQIMIIFTYSMHMFRIWSSVFTKCVCGRCCTDALKLHYEIQHISRTKSQVGFRDVCMSFCTWLTLSLHTLFSCSVFLCLFVWVCVSLRRNAFRLKSSKCVCWGTDSTFHWLLYGLEWLILILRFR